MIHFVMTRYTSNDERCRGLLCGCNCDGKCDKANLLDGPDTCTGDWVMNICNERVLEGEVNVVEWCLSEQQGCTKNGECADPDLCKNRCDLGLNASDWIKKWEYDHSRSMETIMNESWKFPVQFEDPFLYRDFYTSASLEDVCPSGNVAYNRCRDFLIPDAQVFNVTHKYTGVWEEMPSFHSCQLTYHVVRTVNGRATVNFSEPIWAGYIELVSDDSRTAAFGRLARIMTRTMEIRLHISIA